MNKQPTESNNKRGKTYLALKVVSNDFKSIFVSGEPFLCTDYSQIGKRIRCVHPNFPFYIVSKDKIHFPYNGTTNTIYDIQTGMVKNNQKVILISVMEKDLVKKTPFYLYAFENRSIKSVKDMDGFLPGDRGIYGALSLRVLEVVPENVNYIDFIKEKCKQYHLPFVPDYQ